MIFRYSPFPPKKKIIIIGEVRCQHSDHLTQPQTWKIMLINEERKKSNSINFNSFKKTLIKFEKKAQNRGERNLYYLVRYRICRPYYFNCRIASAISCTGFNQILMISGPGFLQKGFTFLFKSWTLIYPFYMWTTWNL